MTRAPATRRRWALPALLFAVCSLGSCSFLADEFTSLNVAGPVALAAPDAPIAGTRDRP